MKTLLLAFFFLSINSFAVDDGPKVHIAKGCLCLDCPYFVKGQRSGLWKPLKDVDLLSSPEDGKRKSFSASAGENLLAVDGEIHVTPGKLEVIFDHKAFKKGDFVYIIQEDADAGTWKVWHKGKEYFEDLSIMVSKKEPCKNPTESCWAKVITDLKSSWWVKLENKSKQSGWTKSVNAFSFDRSSCM